MELIMNNAYYLDEVGQIHVLPDHIDPRSVAGFPTKFYRIPQPTPPAGSKVNREYKHFTGRDKQNIFNDTEKRAIYTAAYITPDIDVLMLVKEMDNAEYVTYSDPSMFIGLEVLEAKGLITPERHQEIIATMTAERE